MKQSKRTQEAEARRQSDVMARVMGREDIDYGSDELPTAPREIPVRGSADQEDSGMKVGERGLAYSIEEAEMFANTHRDPYVSGMLNFLLIRIKRLESEGG